MSKLNGNSFQLTGTKSLKREKRYSPEEWPVLIDRTTGKERDDYNYLWCKERGIPCSNTYNSPSSQNPDSVIKNGGQDGNRHKGKGGWK